MLPLFRAVVSQTAAPWLAPAPLCIFRSLRGVSPTYPACSSLVSGRGGDESTSGGDATLERRQCDSYKTDVFGGRLQAALGGGGGARSACQSQFCSVGMTATERTANRSTRPPEKVTGSVRARARGCCAQFVRAVSARDRETARAGRLAVSRSDSRTVERDETIWSASVVRRRDCRRSEATRRRDARLGCVVTPHSVPGEIGEVSVWNPSTTPCRCHSGPCLGS